TATNQRLTTWDVLRVRHGLYPHRRLEPSHGAVFSRLTCGALRGVRDVVAVVVFVEQTADLFAQTREILLLEVGVGHVGRGAGRGERESGRDLFGEDFFTSLVAIIADLEHADQTLGMAAEQIVAVLLPKIE